MHITDSKQTENMKDKLYVDEDGLTIPPISKKTIIITLN